jgi:hypothetical protein
MDPVTPPSNSAPVNLPEHRHETENSGEADSEEMCPEAKYRLDWYEVTSLQGKRVVLLLRSSEFKRDELGCSKVCHVAIFKPISVSQTSILVLSASSCGVHTLYLYVFKAVFQLAVEL